MFTFFVEGGLGFMTILTVLLVAIFFAAWKAPRWVKEIGALALALGILSFVIGIRQALSALFDVAGARGNDVATLFDLISPRVLFGGLKVTLNSVIYGIAIYLVSLIVRMFQKPRL